MFNGIPILKPVVIIIPIFSDKISQAQLISLRQCFRILRSYTVALVYPVGLDTNLYDNEAALSGISLKKAEFDPGYFDGIPGYNRLLLSLDFFKRFDSFEYMLIYQTDSYVFRDELVYWCNKGLDFIGAPWFSVENDRYTHEMTKVGNGGFSLRNIQSSLKMLKRINELKKWRALYYAIRLDLFIKFGSIIKVIKSFYKIKSESQLHYIFNYADTNEDHYWTEIIAPTFTDFKVAGCKEGISFSFEVNPSWLFIENNHQLPFGCHAWEKHEPDFWTNHIAELAMVKP